MTPSLPCRDKLPHLDIPRKIICTPIVSNISVRPPRSAPRVFLFTSHQLLLPTLSTPMHRFAQCFPAISIDAIFICVYLPSQIEPGSTELYGSVYKAQRVQALQRVCRSKRNRRAAKLKRKARSLYGEVCRAPVERQVNRQVESRRNRI